MAAGVTPARFRSLGEKRNACTAVASPDVDGFLVADDDDIYLPHWFWATADALANADWSRPGLVLLEDGDGLREAESDGLYHGGWAFRKDAFYRVRGYGPHNNGEDQELAGRLNEAGAKCCDPCSFVKPFYIYRYDNATVTVGGAFLSTNSTKGGSTGTLYSVGHFSGGDKSLGSGDSLSVQGAFTQADDGV